MAETIDAPITLEHTAFVDYAFNHWLDSLKAGVRPKTLCLLGPPGIGKSSAAYAIEKRMTDYVRANPQIIFGVASLDQAVTLLEEERARELRGRVSFDLIMKNADRDKPLDTEALDSLIEVTVEARLRLLDPLTKEDVKAVCEILDFSSKLPEDLGGLPFRNGDFVDYCPQRWVAKLCGKFSFGVYVQDDLPAAAQAMQVAGRQSALESRIHENRFADAILVVVTGNRREDKASAATLPSHFRNSVTLLAIEPGVDEWKKWYGAQRGVDPVVSSFLSWKPDLLSETPKDSKDKLGAFASPRQWHSLGLQFVTAQRCGDEVLLAVASGLVGKAIALEFCAFVEIRNTLVDPDEVLDNPQVAMPKPLDMLDEPSKRCAMATALGERAAHRWKKLKGKARDETPEKLLGALAWISQAGDEYSAVGVQTFLDLGGNLTAIARMARKAKTDPVIGRLLDHVKVALLGMSE